MQNNKKFIKEDQFTYSRSFTQIIIVNELF